MTSLPWYATREEVARELDFKEPARSAPRLDRVIAAVSRDIDGMCHRRFWPQVASRSFDWPNMQYARSWRLWLGVNELISVTSLTSGGVAISADDYFLRRGDDLDVPPYTRIEIDLGSNAAFGGGGDTHQRDIVVTGLYGYSNDETSGGSVDGAVTSSATTMHVTDSATVGVGSVIRVGAERMLVTGKTMRDTGQNLGAGIDAQAKTVTVPVSDGTEYHVGEIVLIDAERMLIDDIAGNNLIVQRAFDGTVLATHALNADVYALRTLTVARAALGTTAAAMGDTDPIAVWQPPASVRDLCVAEATARLLQGRSGWARVVGSGDNQREASGRGLVDLREQVRTSHARKARLGVV